MQILLTIILSFLTSWVLTQGAGHSYAQNNADQKLQRLERRAKNYFESKRYEKAVYFLTQYLKSAPSDNQARSLLGRSLYKLGQFDEAQQAFEVLSLEDQDPETRYEIAQTALKTRNFSKALIAFQSVPNGHPLYDLANYYGAICAANEKNYTLAAQLMRQAVVLPSKLAPSKQVYLKHIEEMIAKQNKPKPLPKPVALPSPPPIESEGYGLKPHHYIRVSLFREEQSSSSPVLEKYTQQSPNIGWSLSSKIPLNAKREDEPDHMRLHLAADFHQLSKKGLEQQSLETHAEQLQRRLRNKIGESESILTLQASILPQWYIAQDLWFIAGAELISTTADWTKKGSFSHVAGILALAYQSSNLNSELSFKILDTSETTNRIYYRSSQQLKIVIFPINRLSITSKLEAQQYTYDASNIEGPIARNILAAGVRLRFFDQLFFNLQAFQQESQSQRLLFEQQALNAIEFSESRNGFQASLHGEILSWLSLKLAWDTNANSFSGLEPNLESAKTLLESRRSEKFESLTSELNFLWQF